MVATARQAEARRTNPWLTRVTNGANKLKPCRMVRRLDAALAAGHDGARGMVDAVLRELAAFTGSAPPSDDRTLLAAKFVTSSSLTEHRPGERRPRSAEPLTPR